MSKKRASPGIGHNSSDLPEHVDINTALAIKLVFEEEKKKLREREKRANKRIESMGVRQDDVKFLQGLDGKTGEEVVETFRRNWHLIGAIHQDKHEQLDIFAPKPEAPAVRAAYYTLGLLKGLKGEDPDIPPAVTGESRQQYTEGHNEGMDRRAAAWALIGQADRNEPIDGTGKTPAPKGAAAVGAQAAKDFAQDEGADPLVVGGVTYPTIRQANAARARLAAGPQVAVDNTKPQDAEVVGTVVVDGEKVADIVDGSLTVVRETNLEGVGQDAPPMVETPVAKTPVLKPDFHDWAEDWTAWTGAQTMEMRRWLESLDGEVPLTTHEGVGGYWRALQEEKANVEAGGEDEAPAPAPAAPPAQAAELPDPADIEAGARKLAESGFVPPKSGRKPRNLAK